MRRRSRVGELTDHHRDHDGAHKQPDKGQPRRARRARVSAVYLSRIVHVSSSCYALSGSARGLAGGQLERRVVSV